MDDYTRYLILKTAARSLVLKLDEIFNSDEYRSIFTIAFVHGVQYHGQNCKYQLDILRNLVNDDD